MESSDRTINIGASAPLPNSKQDENSQSSQLSPHSSYSQADQALLTQLPPAGRNSENSNTQLSMPWDSQYSQLLLATQPAYNDSQFGENDDENETSQSSQQFLLTTQPTNTQLSECDNMSSTLRGHVSKALHLQSQQLLLTQQQPHSDNNKTSCFDDRMQQYELTSSQNIDEDDENDNILSYNTQQNSEHDDDDSSDDDGDIERLVEEKNLAVSLSMEAIEDFEESQRSRGNEVQSCDSSHNNYDDESAGRLKMKDTTAADISLPDPGCRFATVGDLDDNNYDRQYESSKKSSFVGFKSAETDKAIALTEEGKLRANRMLDEESHKLDDAAAVATLYAVDDNGDEKKQDEFSKHSSLVVGFTNGGSGESIVATEDGRARANVLFDEEKQGGYHDKDSQNYNQLSSSAFAVEIESGSNSVAADESAKSAPSSMKLTVNDKKDNAHLNTTTKTTTNVTNPYTRKRPLHQISHVGKDKASTANASSTATTLAAPTPSRKLVFNPYAKSVHSTIKSVIRNPYAKVPNVATESTTFPAVAPPPSQSVQLRNKSVRSVTNMLREAPQVAPRKETPLSRLKGISFSLPIAERLPSRNVSYRPAEILTVGELHQYLYTDDTIGERDAFNSLQTVRITGVLISVARSSSAESDGSRDDAHSTGTFLLIGDPLEKNRQQSVSSSRSEDTNSTMTRTATKSYPMSILKNKHSSNLRMKQSEQTANAYGKTSDAAAATGNKPMTKPILRFGLLNNKKPKKFIYVGNKNRSSLGGGLHRKFVTPKRGPTLAASITNGTSQSSAMMRRPTSLAKSVRVSSSRKNMTLESVIRSHPAPLVPVWIGSSLDSDGLDGSVVNDLVMVIGDAIIEHCTRCREKGEDVSGERSGENGRDTSNDDLPSKGIEKQSLSIIKNVRHAALSIAASASTNEASTCQSFKKKPFCRDCVCFLSARIVKNANGTDMNLQAEALKVRRKYFRNRKKQMERLMQGVPME